MIAVLLVVSPFLLFSAQSAEPSLEEVLDYLGFTNRTISSVETFSAGTYNITLYAEFAGYSDQNELSYYEVGTSVYNVIFTGPEGGSNYIDPPVTKSFTADYQFGLSMISPGPKRYFTETSLNGDGIQHAKIYENLDDPGMFLIGFENQWGGGDKDYNDMVFSLKPYAPTVEYNLTITTTTGGTTNPAPGTYSYDVGSNISVQALPSANYFLNHWVLDGSDAGSANPISVLMDNDHILDAIFTSPPYANFTFTPEWPAADEEVTFNATNSYDLDGTIISYYWEFGDNTTAEETDPTATHVYVDPGNYTVKLTVTDDDGLTNSTTATVIVNTPLLRVSLPDGTYVGCDPDRWLSWSWLLNINNTSGTFTLRINNTWPCLTSYDTHLIIALNDAAYANLVSLSVNGATMSKGDFQFGTPRPYGMMLFWFECLDVYPTWFNDTYIVGTIGPKSYVDLTVSVTFSNATDVRMHFDAYGSWVTPPPKCIWKVTHNLPCKDSTVLFWPPPPVVKYHLTVKTDPLGIVTISGEDWYDNCTYVDLTAPTPVSGSPGVQYLFDYWDVDGGNVSGNPINVHMDANHTATAHYITQYYLTVVSPYGTPSGEGWYNGSTLAYACLDTGMVDHGNDTRRVFTNWSGNASGTNYTQSDSIHMDGPKTATANWKTQYLVTFNQTGLDDTANNTVVTVNGAPKNFSDLSFELWADNGSPVTYNYKTIVSSTVSGKRFRLDSISSPPSPFTVTGPVTITGNYKTQYQLTVRTNGLGTNVTNVYNDTTTLGTATDATPYTNWFDDGSSLQLNIDSPISVGSTKFVFTQWSGAATGTSRPVSVNMDSAKDITANYKTQYEVTFSQSGVDTDFTGTVVTIDGTGYGVGTLSVSFWWDENSQHNFSFASPLVVNASKQYVWISTLGLSTSQNDTLTITSPGSVTGYYSTGVKYQITFDQTGVDSDFNGTIVTIEGTPYNRTTLPVSFWWDESSIHNFAFQSPLAVTPNAKQYVWNSTSGLSSLQSGSITVSMSGSVIGNYTTQYYLTMNKNFGTVTPGDGWHDAGFQVSISATPPSAGPGERYVWNGWTGTGTGSYSGTDNPTSITMNGPITETASWTHEYKLTIATNYGSTNPSVGEHWYEAGSTVQINTTAPSVGAGERYVWNGWTGSGTGSYSGMDKPASITMDSPITETASWTHEYYLTVSSAHGTPGGSGWYEEGDTASATVTPLTVSGPTGIRYVFTHWSGDASGSSSPSNPITMDAPKTAVANWKTRYKLTVETDPPGLSPGPTPPTDWYNESASVTLTAQTVSGYTFDYWDVDGWSQGIGVNPITVPMDNLHTATAHYQRVAPPPAVGGYALPINLDLGTSNSLIHQIGLASTLSVAVTATIILIKRRKKTLKQEH